MAGAWGLRVPRKGRRHAGPGDADEASETGMLEPKVQPSPLETVLIEIKFGKLLPERSDITGA